MAWYDSDYRQQVCITVITDSTATSRNVRVTIPVGLDAFWNAVDDDGFGVRFTDSDGVTLLAHDRQSWTKATRTGVFDIETATMAGASNRAVLLWMYFEPGTVGSDTPTAVATASQLTGEIELAAPNSYVVVVQTPPANTGEPDAAFQKSVDEAVHVWLDWTPMLQPPSRTYNGRLRFEEPFHAGVQVLDNGGTAVPSMTDAADMRWVVYRAQGSSRLRVALRVLVQAGVNLSAYAVEAKLTTAAPGSGSAHQERATRVGFYTRNVLEA